jgi:predicted TIM-barrel fold metal-dependent hydrolase
MASPQVLVEPIIAPDLPIIDPHHHLWCWTKDAIAATATPDNPFGAVLALSGRYMLDEILADIETGHNVLGTVFVDAHAMYRTTGPEAMKTVGEVEFVAGIAAMAESGVFGPVRVAAGIVGAADLMLGDGVQEVLEAHIAAGGGRYRGVRNPTAHDPDPAFKAAADNPPHKLLDKTFRTGFRHLAKMGLTYDVWLFHPQLPDVIDLARAFPDTQIILDHIGMPLGVANYKRAETFAVWRESLRAVAKCPNIALKVGGMGMPLLGFKSFLANPPFSSEQLAAEWKPYVEVCVEAFGVERCMFESNFPVDSGGANYQVMWNAFKRIAAGYSKDEKAALFAGTARKIYKLNI